MSLLQLDGLGRTYGALHALHDISLDIPAGTRHAIIGPNGAGKSTLLNLIAGTSTPTSGRVLLGGKDITRTPVHRRAHAGIARTWQHPAVLDQLTVGANVALGASGRAMLRRHDKVAVATRALAALTAVGLTDRADTPAHQLPYGERRLLELAIALSGEPRLLLLDEPSAGLGPDEITRLRTLIADLPRHVTVLLVDHRLDLVFDIADTVTVLHHGRHLTTGTPEHVRAHPDVQAAYLAAEHTHREHHTRPTHTRPSVLRVRHLSAAYHGGPVLHDIDLDLGPGEVVVIVGRNGAGKTTLINTLAGLHPTGPGTLIEVAGKPLTGQAPHRIVHSGLALVPQGRRLFKGLTVAEHLTIARPSGDRPAVMSRADILALFPALSTRLRYTASQLSGGEQQMLALARALLTGPRLLLLDEPSEGLAPAVIAQLAHTITHLSAAGVSVLLTEQNIGLALHIADRVVVLDRGAVSLARDAGEVRTDPGRLLDLLAVPAYGGVA